MVGTFLALRTPVAPNSFLVLPTQTVRMRRFLIHLWQRSPRDARNMVVLNGDAISFHSVYRDRDVVWNILDLPYSLVFFSHRNPIDQAAGFSWTKKAPGLSTTGTHDILLYRDIFEAFLYAASDNGTLLGDPLQRFGFWIPAGLERSHVFQAEDHARVEFERASGIGRIVLACHGQQHAAIG